MGVLVLAGFWLTTGGCGQDDGVDPVADGAPGDCQEVADYTRFVAPLFERQCLPCHSASLEAAARQGAPAGVDFDTENDVEDGASGIQLRAVELRSMPPGEGLTECEVQRLGAYLQSIGAAECEPGCSGRQCGDDGCGGSCGLCGGETRCDDSDGQCVAADCVPQCQGVACGDDGCGGQCGTCGAGLACDATSSCTCQPSCDGRSCGDDGCGGSCGPCGASQVCAQDGACICIPACGGISCGDDGCGGSCGSCGPGLECTSPDTCSCVPDCTGRQCGDDGCGGSCGTCAGARTCDTRAGRCVINCSTDCSGRACGDDGCGGSCGSCGAGDYCDPAGSCLCAPDCFGRACGDDGCGGSCGECPQGTTCGGGQCACVAACGARQCGGDGCGGSCGTCPDGDVCADGACVEQCVPACGGAECGDDGCGGSCGACAGGRRCDPEGSCVLPELGFAADVYPILMDSGCGTNACHGGVRPADGLDLSSADAAHAGLVEVNSGQCGDRRLVATGAPDSSYLVNKVTGVGLCSGSRMPKTGPTLTADEVDVLRAWIAGGAAP